MGTLVGSPGQEDPGALFARDTEQGCKIQAAPALSRELSVCPSVGPLRNLLDLHWSLTQIDIHELPCGDSLRSVPSIVSNCHTVRPQIRQASGLVTSRVIETKLFQVNLRAVQEEGETDRSQ